MRYRRTFDLVRGWESFYGRAEQNLSAYRAGEAVGRLNTWLCNFDGPAAQTTALRAAAALQVVDPVRCTAQLLEALTEACGEVYHTAHGTSGEPLLNVLEKRHGVRKRFVLRRDDFSRVGRGDPPPRLAEPGVIAHWDTVYGTGTQHDDAVRRLEADFPSHVVFGCYLLAAADEELPSGAYAAERAPRCPPGFLDLDERYAEAAMPDAARRDRLARFRLDMLGTPPDNAPNNLPVVLWAPAHDGWATLLDRRETVVP